MRIFYRERTTFKVIKIPKVFYYIVFMIVISITVIYGISHYLKPTVNDIADSVVNDRINLIISNAVLETIKNNGIQYSDLVNIEKRDDITILTGNTILMNKIKNESTIKIINDLNENSTFDITIPLIQLFRNSLIHSGKMNIKVTVTELNTFNFNFTTKFESAGINQTNSIINANISTEYKVITPVSVISSSVKTDVPIANNVIVGQIPDSYVNVTSSPEELKNDVLQLSE